MPAVRSLSKEGDEKVTSPRWDGAYARAARTHWTTRVILAEFFVIFSTSYGVSVLYHLLAYGDFARTALYLPLSFFLAVFYSMSCLADHQYDFSSEKWGKEGVQRALGAMGVAFACFLSFIFIFDLGAYFSRGTFLSQLVLVSAAIAVARVVLVQQLEYAVRSGRMRGRGIALISFAPNDVSKYASGVCSALDEIVSSHTVFVPPFTSDRKRKRAAIEKLERIRDECRKSGVDVAAVIYDAPNADLAQIAVEILYEMPVRIRLLPIAMIPFMQRSRVADAGEFSSLDISTHPFSLVDRALKRTLDLIVAAAVVVLFCPLLLLVAIAIKLDSSGPVLFRQMRHGFNNEPIEVLKFRTMKTGSSRGKFQQTSRGDQRITRVGRFLRITNVDELPQLFNVLRGEMSIVGPRPHATIHNEMFAKHVKMIYRRHNVKPGMTGWAQVNGLRGATDTHEQMRKRIEYDLYYIDHWSIFLDIRILLMTILSKKAYTNAY